MKRWLAPWIGCAAAAGILMLATLVLGAPTARAYSDRPLTLPRFESLRWDKVNLRAGPGDQYPIRWVLTRKGMPVEVVDTYDVWRKIRDWQGSVGWVHERMLIGNRTAIITGEERVLHAAPRRSAPPVARAEVGVVARLLSCDGHWCQLDAQGVKGWLPRDEFFGVLPQEQFN